MWAENSMATAVGVVAALTAGVPAIPVNPKSGHRELAHILSDSAPSAVLAAAGAELPAGFDGVTRITADLGASGAVPAPAEPAADSPALIVYTSGTTGPPKGAVLPRRALAANLDALATAWAWTQDDVVAHALPLFHVHGLVLGTLGPLRRGGSSWHLGGFSPDAVAAGLTGPATMLFAVPTMYHRLADAAGPASGRGAGGRPAFGVGFGGAAGGRARPPGPAHRPPVVERYGMSETLMIASTTAAGERRAGSVAAARRRRGQPPRRRRRGARRRRRDPR